MPSPYYNEDLQKSVLSSYGTNAEAAGLERQMQMANALRGKSFQGQEGVQAGRVYVAPSWLSAAGQGLQAYAGKKMGDEAQTGLQGVASKQAGVADQYLQALYGKNKGSISLGNPGGSYGGAGGDPQLYWPEGGD
jgi:hypothetical protein